jgi:hypothetical protein
MACWLASAYPGRYVGKRVTNLPEVPNFREVSPAANPNNLGDYALACWLTAGDGLAGFAAFLCYNGQVPDDQTNEIPEIPL